MRWVRPPFVAGVLTLVLSGLGHGAALQARGVTDAQVKAAYLVNFARFVQWPDPGRGPLVICIVGDEAVMENATQTVRGRSVNGRELQTRRLASGEYPAGCQMLFLGVMPDHDATELMQRLVGPVLTVGATAQFLRTGGMMRIYVEDNKVRFQINQKNVEATGLKVSSQLLALATP
jgi:hypothetical protein